MITKGNGAAQQSEGARRCAIYTRKSTAHGLEQDFNSLDAQREACEQYITSRAAEGWVLMPERYDDGGFTGANTERPAFQRLLADIEAGRVDVVVVYKVDRLSRSLLDFAQVMDRFSKADTAFVSVTQNFSTADAMNRLTLNMLMSFSEFEREMIAERTRDKMEAARRRGKWTGGRLPLGYDSEDKRLVVNPLEALVVREIFALYLERGSALEVAQELNVRQVSMKQGEVSEQRTWSKDAVLRVLRNPLYAGLVGSGSGLHPGQHEAIVAREVYEQAQAQLDQSPGGGRGGRARNQKYLLSGLLRCGCCDWVLVGASTRKKRRGGSREYRYYRSLSRDKKGRGACKVRPIAARAIEDLVVAQLRDLTADGALAAEVRTKVAERVGKEEEAVASQRRPLEREVHRLTSESSSLAGETADGQGEAELEARGRAVQRRLARARGLLGELAVRQQALAEMSEQSRWVSKVLENFGGLWEVMTLANRSRLVRAVVHEVVVDEDAGELRLVLSDFDKDFLGDAPRVEDAEGESPADGRRVVVLPLSLVRQKKTPRKKTRRKAAAGEEGPIRAAQMLALAHELQGLLDRGEVEDRTTLAREVGMTKSRLSQLLDLTLLAPDIQEEVLMAVGRPDERQPITERMLRSIVREPVWEEQRRLWAEVYEERGHEESVSERLDGR